MLQNFVIYLQEGKPMFSSGIDSKFLSWRESFQVGGMSQFLASGDGILAHPTSRENLVTFFPSSFIDLVFLNEFHSIQGYSVTTWYEVTRKKNKFETCLLKVLQIILQKECISFVSLCNSKMNGRKHNFKRSFLSNNASLAQPYSFSWVELKRVALWLFKQEENTASKQTIE